MSKKRKKSRISNKLATEEKDNSSTTPSRETVKDNQAEDHSETDAPSLTLNTDPWVHLFSRKRFLDTLIVLFSYLVAMAMFFGAAYNRNHSPTRVMDAIFFRSYYITPIFGLIYLISLLSRKFYRYKAKLGWLFAISSVVSLTGLALGFYFKESYYRIYITQKVIPLYPLGWALLILGLAKIALFPNIRRNSLKSPWFYVMIAYAAWEAIHPLFGIMPAVSYLGSVPRQMGVVAILSMMATGFALYTWVVDDPENRLKWIGRFLIFVAIALAWRAAYEMTLASTRFYRPSGFAGNPDFFGDHYVLLVPLTFIAYFTEKKDFWKWLSLAAFIGQVLTSAYIRTRGAWLGIGIAGLVVLFTLETKLDRKEIFNRLAILVVLSLLSIPLSHSYIQHVIPMRNPYAKGFLRAEWGAYLMAALSVGPYVLRIMWLLVRENKESIIRLGLGISAALVLLFAIPQTRNVVIKQIQSALKLKRMKQGREARPFVWRDTLSLIKDNWLTGVGRENYRVAFVRHKSRRLAIIDPTVNYRSSHNMYLDLLAMEGVLGFLLFMGLLGAGLFLGIRRKSSPYHFAMGVYIAGYAAHVVVIYDVVSTAFTIFVAMALAAAGASPEKTDETESNPSPKMKVASPAVLMGLLILFLAGIIPTSYFSWIQHDGDLNLARAKLTAMRLKSYVDREKRMYQRALNKAKSKGNEANVIAIKRRWNDRKEQIRAMAEKVWKSSLRTARYCTPLGYNCYLASHQVHVLTYLSNNELPKGLDKNTIKQTALRMAKKGVRNNTNPESAYSRLGSAFYAVGDPANALRGFNTSIYYDHYFYDTHRMRAIIYMNDYCEFEKAQKELDFAMGMLTFSHRDRQGPGRAVKLMINKLKAVRRQKRACLMRKQKRGLGDPPSEDETFVGRAIWNET